MMEIDWTFVGLSCYWAVWLQMARFLYRRFKNNNYLRISERCSRHGVTGDAHFYEKARDCCFQNDSNKIPHGPVLLSFQSGTAALFWPLILVGMFITYEPKRKGYDPELTARLERELEEGTSGE